MEIATFYILYFSLIGIYVVSTGFGFSNLTKFISETNHIYDESDIEKFKRLAIRQMILIFPMLIGGFGAIALFLYCGFSDITGERELIIMIVLILVNFVFTRKVKKLESEIFNISADTDELLKVRDHIVNVWQKKLLPIFE